VRRRIGSSRGCRYTTGSSPRRRRNDRHLDHDVVERARLDARQRRHLRARLHLEDADGVGLAQEVVDRVLLGQRPEVDRHVVEGLHLLDAAVQRVEHAEAQQVELHETDRRAVVLVPLQDRAPGHATPLDRADLDHRSIAQHHPGRVDAQVSRTIEHLARHGRDELGHVGTRGHGVAIDAVAKRVGLFLVVTEGARHVAQRRARSVRDDRGHLGRVAPVVAFVDVLDHLFAPPGLDVDVDVRGAVTRRGQESLKEQIQLHRVGVRDTQRETDRRVRGRTTALTVDVVATTELGDVPDREEVTGEAEGLDDTEFVIDLVPRARNALALACAVTLRRALSHDHF